MIDLKTMSDDALELSTLKAVKTERKIMHWVLLHLLELQDRRIFAKYEYDGMYTYMTRKLGYSGTAASLRIQAMKLLRSTPEVFRKIESGNVCLTQMAQVQRSIVLAEESGHIVSTATTLKIFEQIESKSGFETKSILAKELNLPVVHPEFIKPQSDDSVRLEITLSAEQFKNLEQAKDLLSHVCHDGNWANVIANLAEKFNQQKLVGRKQFAAAKTTNALATNLTQTTTATEVADSPAGFTSENKGSGDNAENIYPDSALNEKSKKASGRPYISMGTKRILFRRAQNCCEYRDAKTRHRCTSKYQLQIDHIHPWCKGGSNDISNLRILCRAHNNISAEQNGILRKSGKILVS